MITLVIGKPKSGKSDIAEDLAVKGDHKNRYYIATMKIMDEDGKKRAKEHQKRREGKGFVTLEIPDEISVADKMMKDPQDSVVLLECMANLVGNLMYRVPNTMWLCEQGEAGHKEFVISVIDRVTSLANKVRDIIVVTTDYEPEESDDEETSVYKALLSGVNREMERIADKVIRS